jgi:flagellar M-ring protein FliF
VLSLGAESASSPVSGRRLEIKTAIEESLERRVQSMLDAALGHGQTITRVSAQVNFDQIERTEESFDPKAVLKQRTRSTETTKGRSAVPAPPPPAADAGAPQTTPAPTTASGTVNENDGQRESESVTYEISRIVARTLTSPGEIRRLSIAVVVNAPRPAAGAAPDPKTSPPARAPEELEKIRGVVMTAVGFNESRGDSVTVAELPFDTSLLDRERALLDQPAPPVSKLPELSVDLLRTPVVVGAGVLSVLLLAFVAWLILRGRSRTRARAELALSLERVPAPAPARGAAAVAPAQPAVPAIPHAPQPIVSDDVLQLTREREEIRQKAFAMASGEPDATAQLLRAWLVKKKAAVSAGSAAHGG